MKATRTEQDNPIIVGGDFNIILDPDIDGRGRNNKKKDSAKLVQDMHLDFDLLDIWCIRNPTASRFTWRQKTLVVQRRLDYWLISDSLYKTQIFGRLLKSVESFFKCDSHPWLFLKKQTRPTAKVKLAAKYSNIDIYWKSVYLLTFRITLETKLREFQLLLNRIVFTNEKLFYFGMADSPSCLSAEQRLNS